MPRASQLCVVSRRPDVEVLAAMPGRRVHEARAGVVRHMIAVEQGHVELSTALSAWSAEGWATQ